MFEVNKFTEGEMKVTAIPEDSLNMNSEDESCRGLNKSCLVVRHALSPLDSLMKICGMTYGSSCPLNTHIGVRHKVQRLYTIFMGIVFCVATARFVPLFFMQDSLPKFIQIEFFVWHMKCMVQELFCIYICSRYGRKVSRLQSLISEFDRLLLSYKRTDVKVNKKFVRLCRMIFGLMAIVLVTNIGLLSASFFYMDMPKTDFPIPWILIHPFETKSMYAKITFFVITVYFTIAWLLPVILYCILCLALCLVFDQFCSSLKKLPCTAVKARISHIRAEYLKLQQLSLCTDNCVGFIALCVYLVDVALFCFHMYHLLYYATGPVQKLAPGFWAFISVCNLFCMSLCASKVVDEGQSIYSFVSKMSTNNIDLESHAQLMMLLQDMAIDPPALTVWKLVPLYKSIVISVFVSLITYFTLLIQFKT